MLRGNVGSWMPNQSMGFDQAAYQEHILNFEQASRIAGARAEGDVVLALSPRAPLSQVRLLLAQVSQAQKSGKVVKVVFVDSGLSFNPRAKLIEAALRLQFDIRPLTIERTDKENELLDLEWLYGEIRQTDSSLRGFSLFLLADPSLKVNMTWQNPLIQLVVSATKDTFFIFTSSMEADLKASLAAALSQ
ncbi:MAG: hypothetical protein A3A86_06845 [Elusimicrobia bacterium RIFCSPLOWO2_01_FULL_60_11]|nr:MAG: hypothetical protein A3A86_06845 [Elusimicrobia bacterium RIFCSPLOWO2_01_FULL_60_11]